MRLFLALDLDAAVRDRLARILAQESSAYPEARWVNVASLHLTLVFLGAMEEQRRIALEQDVAEIARACPPLRLVARGAGVFGARSPRVLWIGCGGDLEPLASLQRDLAKAASARGVAVEERAYAPHLTLARSKEASGDPELARIATRLGDVDLGAFVASEVALYDSKQHPRDRVYEEVMRAPLLAI